MISKLFNFKKTNRNFLILLIKFVLAILVIYALGFNLSPELRASDRFVLSEVEDEIIVELLNDFKFAHSEKVIGGNLEYRLYLEEGNVGEVKQYLEGKNINFSHSETKPLGKLTYEHALMFLVSLSLFSILGLWLLLSRIVDSKSVILLGFANVLSLMVVGMMTLAILSLLGELGWQISEFTITTGVAVACLIVFYQLYTYISWKFEHVDIKTKLTGEELSNYYAYIMHDHIKFYLYFSLILVPFLFLYDFRVEVILIMLALPITFLSNAFTAPFFVGSEAGRKKGFLGKQAKKSKK